MTYQAKHCKDCFDRLPLDDIKSGEVMCASCRYMQQMLARKTQQQKGGK
jgi:uncharacterized Zn finger protein (UPF0148 family)